MLRRVSCPTLVRGITGDCGFTAQIGFPHRLELDEGVEGAPYRLHHLDDDTDGTSERKVSFTQLTNSQTHCTALHTAQEEKERETAGKQAMNARS